MASLIRGLFEQFDHRRLTSSCSNSSNYITGNSSSSSAGVKPSSCSNSSNYVMGNSSSLSACVTSKLPSSCTNSSNYVMGNSSSLSASVTSKSSKSLRRYAVQLDSYLETYRTSLETVVVESLCIYKTPMQQGPTQQVVRTLLPQLPHIYHHFLIFEVSSRIHGRLLIRAEKSRGNTTRKPGISVRIVPFVEEKVIVVKHKVGQLSESVPVSLLLKILTMHPPDYDVTRDNCWTYADHTLRRLLRAFEFLRPEDGSRIQAHLRQIPRLVMPAQFGKKMLDLLLVRPCMEIRIIPFESEDPK